MMRVGKATRAALLLWCIAVRCVAQPAGTNPTEARPASVLESPATMERPDDTPAPAGSGGDVPGPSAAAGQANDPTPAVPEIMGGVYGDEISPSGLYRVTPTVSGGRRTAGGEPAGETPSPPTNRTGRHILIMDCLMDGSHSHMQRIMARELASRGHQVTLLTFPKLLYWPTEQDKQRINFRVFKSDLTPEMTQASLDNWTRMALRGELSSFSWYVKMWLGWISEDTKRMFSLLNRVIEDQLENTDFEALRSAKFDLVMCEVMHPICSAIAHDILGVRFVNTINGGPLGTRYSRWIGQPSPLSYVPEFVTWYTDVMTFPQRVKNNLMHAVSLLLYDHILFRAVDRARARAGMDTSTGTRELMGRAELFLFNWDFTLEFPRPVSPNSIMIGGLSIRKPEPLPQHLEEFVQGAGEDGVVVFSVSTLLRVMDMDMANMIGAALARLPQRVIWKYVGNEKPATQGNNTMTAAWIPQQHLLAHEKTRLLIYHGGLNGAYEAMYHGVPVVGLPLFTDQVDDMVRLKYRLGMAEFFPRGVVGLTSDKLYDCIQTVLGNSSYRENAQRVSRRLHDMEANEGALPLARTARWVEYAMEHGGSHLRPKLPSLAWYQHYLLDVLAVFAVVACAILWSAKKCWQTFCARRH